MAIVAGTFTVIVGMNWYSYKDHLKLISWVTFEFSSLRGKFRNRINYVTCHTWGTFSTSPFSSRGRVWKCAQRTWEKYVISWAFVGYTSESGHQESGYKVWTVVRVSDSDSFCKGIVRIPGKEQLHASVKVRYKMNGVKWFLFVYESFCWVLHYIAKVNFVDKNDSYLCRKRWHRFWKLEISTRTGRWSQILFF